MDACVVVVVLVVMVVMVLFISMGDAQSNQPKIKIGKWIFSVK